MVDSTVRELGEQKNICKMYMIIIFMRTSHIPHIFVSIISVDEEIHMVYSIVF